MNSPFPQLKSHVRSKGKVSKCTMGNKTCDELYKNATNSRMR